MSRLAALVLVLILAACGEEPAHGPSAPAVADLGARPESVEAESAPVRYRPPAGRWQVRSAETAPGQWFDEYAAEDGTASMTLVIFPVRDSRDPSTVLSQALDTFLRGRGTEGFGLSGLRAFDLWGVPAAQAQWTAVVGGSTVQGEARLVLAARELWAFAIGYAQAAGNLTRLETVRRFTTSLEPSEPVFYERRFRDAEAMQVPVTRAEGEPPVLLADVMAVALTLEAGVDARFPLSARPLAEGALRDDVRSGKAEARSPYRDTRAALESLRDREPEARVAAMRALGQRVLQALLARASDGHEPAVRYAQLLRRLRAVAVGDDKDGLAFGEVQCLHEMCAFLVSLGTDREVRPDPKGVEGTMAYLKARWSQLAPAEKEALRASGVAWAALRRDWDRAEPGRRNALRYAILKRVVIPQDAKEGPAWPERRAWKRMRRVSSEDLEGCILRALALSASERTQLVGLLGQERSSGWDLGW